MVGAPVVEELAALMQVAEYRDNQTNVNQLKDTGQTIVRVKSAMIWANGSAQF